MRNRPLAPHNRAADNECNAGGAGGGSADRGGKRRGGGGPAQTESAISLKKDEIGPTHATDVRTAKKTPPPRSATPSLSSPTPSKARGPCVWCAFRRAFFRHISDVSTGTGLREQILEQSLRARATCGQCLRTLRTIYASESRKRRERYQPCPDFIFGVLPKPRGVKPNPNHPPSLLAKLRKYILTIFPLTPNAIGTNTRGVNAVTSSANTRGVDCETRLRDRTLFTRTRDVPDADFYTNNDSEASRFDVSRRGEIWKRGPNVVLISWLFMVSESRPSATGSNRSKNSEKHSESVRPQNENCWAIGARQGLHRVSYIVALSTSFGNVAEQNL
ncbi:hypothetical protein GWI33_006212 [Rhynchophorus ferrugineus]|uniref:Uncharacterized protein n=1 Tax=Rhynchophorus ferrugineus TaxID=354439 RepID=A0A834IMA6_RHYFE|nr:hypothetical protein GWI33_006212 [Rhynchophorus ferrugineus]